MVIRGGKRRFTVVSASDKMQERGCGRKPALGAEQEVVRVLEA